MKSSFLTRLFDLVAPRTCGICGRRLSVGESVLCGVCHLHLPFTYLWRTPYDNEMARLFWGKIPFAGGDDGQRPNSVERVAALFFYGAQTPVSRLIHNMKYNGWIEAGESLGRMAANMMAADRFFEGIDIIVPMPLTRLRQWKRGYNQSMEIARGVSSVTGIPVCNDIVRRVRFDGSQTRKHGWERTQNVDGVFRLKDASKAEGKHILVIDDIVTTGATVASCAQQLCKAPGVRISIMSIGFTKE